MSKAPREAGTAENSGDQPASCLRRSARRPKASFTYPSFTPVCCHSRFQAVRQLGARSCRSRSQVFNGWYLIAAAVPANSTLASLRSQRSFGARRLSDCYT